MTNLTPRVLVTASLLLGGGGGRGATAEQHGAPTFEKIRLSDKFYSEGCTHGDFDRDGTLDFAAGPFWYAGPDRADAAPRTRTSPGVRAAAGDIDRRHEPGRLVRIGTSVAVRRPRSSKHVPSQVAPRSIQIALPRTEAHPPAALAVPHSGQRPGVARRS